MADYIRYANQGATRNKPLSPDLVQALAFLGDMGITFEVFSGGQDHKGRRTGSTRHDGGGAGDGFFYKGDQRLDWSNPEHRPIFQEIVRRGRAEGLTGFGAGPGYMRPGSMHIGFGNPAVWGDGGKGANAPDWLRAAFEGGHSHNVTPSGSAPLSMPQEAPVGVETAAGTLYTGTPSTDPGYNALAALPEPVQQAVALNALAEMFGGGNAFGQQEQQDWYQIPVGQTRMLDYY